MGDNGYTSDEERFDCKSGNYDCNSNASCDNRSDSINGYKKFFSILLIFVIVFSFRMYVLERVIVSGISMYPTFSDGDVMWAKKFDIKELSRYQTVVAKIGGKYVIKRVIALPNEAIQIIDGFVYVDGEKLEGDYGDKTSTYGCAADALILKKDEYFLMGDNRDNSLDSRTYGPVSIKDIKGIVVFRFFPFWKIGIVR